MVSEFLRALRCVLLRFPLSGRLFCGRRLRVLANGLSYLLCYPASLGEALVVALAPGS